MPGTPLPERKSWQALKRHYDEISGQHLRELFAGDPGRGERLTAEAAGLYLDYSKNRVTEETLGLLIALAEAAGLRARIDAMFSGEKINITEGRAVLHVALRAPRDRRILVDGVDVREWDLERLRRHVGTVFQDPEHQFLTGRVIDELTLAQLEEIDFFARHRHEVEAQFPRIGGRRSQILEQRLRYHGRFQRADGGHIANLDTCLRRWRNG